MPSDQYEFDQTMSSITDWNPPTFTRSASPVAASSAIGDKPDNDKYYVDPASPDFFDCNNYSYCYPRLDHNGSPDQVDDISNARATRNQEILAIPFERSTKQHDYSEPTRRAPPPPRHENALAETDPSRLTVESDIITQSIMAGPPNMLEDDLHRDQSLQASPQASPQAFNPPRSYSTSGRPSPANPHSIAQYIAREDDYTRFADAQRGSSPHSGTAGASGAAHETRTERSQADDNITPRPRNRPRRTRSDRSPESQDGRPRIRRYYSGSDQSITVPAANNSARGPSSNASSSVSRHCIRADPKTAGLFIELIEERIELGIVNRQHPVDTILDLETYIRDFYNEYACGSANREPSDNSIIRALTRSADEEPKARIGMIVKAMEKLYCDAGWRLKPVLDGPPPTRPIRNSLEVPPRSTRRSTTSSRRQSSQLSLGRESSTGDPPRTSFSSRTTAPASRSSVNQRSGDNYYTCCHCSNKKFKSKRDWEKHDNIHHPLYFVACVHAGCEYFALRSDMANHWRKIHEIDLSSDSELRERQNAEKFEIPDRGHQRCIYDGCQVVFEEWNGERIRTHIERHQREDGLADHDRQPPKDKCDDPDCGKRNAWKKSPYVLVENRRRYKSPSSVTRDQRTSPDRRDDEDDRRSTTNASSFGQRRHGDAMSRSQSNGTATSISQEYQSPYSFQLNNLPPVSSSPAQYDRELALDESNSRPPPVPVHNLEMPYTRSGATNSPSSTERWSRQGQTEEEIRVGLLPTRRNTEERTQEVLAAYQHASDPQRLPDG